MKGADRRHQTISATAATTYHVAEDPREHDEQREEAEAEEAEAEAAETETDEIGADDDKAAHAGKNALLRQRSMKVVLVQVNCCCTLEVFEKS